MSLLKITLAVVFCVLPLSTSRAEDWTTTTGKTYRGVTVLAHTSITVTVLYSDGGATLNLIDLPPSIQKRFGYDHKAAEAEKAKEDAAVAKEAADLKAKQDLQVARDKADRAAKAADAAETIKEASEDQKQLADLSAKAKADYDSKEKAAITGQVFIITSERETIPMTAIHVHLYSEDEAHAALDILTANGGVEEKKLEPVLEGERTLCVKPAPAAAPAVGAKKPAPSAPAGKPDDALKNYRDTLTKYYSYSSQSYYVQNMPVPLADVVTDANGKFAMQMPKTGSWVLVAQGQHTMNGMTKGYLWIAKISPAAISKGQVVLNDDNLTGDDSLMTGLSDGDIASLVQKKIDDLNPK